MSLNEEHLHAAANDYLWARIRKLEAELARFEKVQVSAGPTPHSVYVHRADGSHEWADRVTLYAKADHELADAG